MVNLRNFNPGTISDQAAGVYPLFPDPTQSAALPGPDDLVAWAKVHKAYEKQVAPLSKRLVKPLGATVDEITLGPIKALEVTPKNWQESDRRIVYVHGGAYTMMSASSTLGSAAMVADVTGQKVLSLDYTVAPKARWEQALDEVKQAFRAIHDLGFPMEKLGAFGDSAGGGMIAGAVLKMRDEVMGMPAALVLLSPWADITETGESYHTLKDAEPVYLYETAL
ncbi:MAG: alpha/beta hydrolase, partial [Alphaproteobacteria bacterium]